VKGEESEEEGEWDGLEKGGRRTVGWELGGRCKKRRKAVDGRKLS